MPWTVDGMQVPLAGWRCNAIKDGGFQGFTGYIPADTVLAHPSRIAQGARLTGWTDAESAIWEGRLSVDPMLERGRALLSASGEMVRAQRAFGRRLYQTRDYSHWQDGGDEPMNFANVIDTIEAEVRESQLWFHLVKDEVYSGDQAHPLAAWFPGAAVGRVAFDLVKSGNSNDADILLQRFTGPSGTRTTDNTYGLGSGGPSAVDETIANAEDGVVLTMKIVSGGGTPSAHRYIRLKNLRVNGIALTDEFRSDEVISDVGNALGYDVAGVQTGANVLPLDWADGSWLDLMLYVAAIEDRRVLILEDRGKGPRLDYGPWEKTWIVRRARGAAPHLSPLELYNKVVVHYTSPSGAAREVSLLASPDPLAILGQTNLYEYTLTDPQADSNLATQVATSLLTRLSVPRYAGTIDIVAAHDLNGVGTVYDVRPGDLVEIPDWAPGKSLTHRVHEVEYTPTGVTLGIESPVTVDGLVALYKMGLARSA